MNDARRRDGEPRHPESNQPARRLTRRSLIGEAAAAGIAASLFAVDTDSALGAAPLVAHELAPSFTPNHTWPKNEAPSNPITIRVYTDPAVAWTVDLDPVTHQSALVMAVKNELLVRHSARTGIAGSAFSAALSQIATLAGSLQDGANDFPLDAPSITPPTVTLYDDIELWVLTKPTPNSPFSEVEALNKLRKPGPVPTRGGGALNPPAASPNHVFVACSLDSCPGGPPTPILHAIPGFRPASPTPRIPRVVVIDSGYVKTQAPSNPEHLLLDSRTTAVPGYSRSPNPDAGWQPCPPDGPVSVPGEPDVLDGVAGHGTFIAGLITTRCPQAQLTVVGERRAITELNRATQQAVWSDELSVARSLLRYSTADVVSCGFAFPTFRGRASSPFTIVMAALRTDALAVVAPAGNEYSTRPFWPACHPDVIGVGATDVTQSIRAKFNTDANGQVSGSNWGPWLKCCCRGQHVQSIFINWSGIRAEDGSPPVQGTPPARVPLVFSGWAQWDGTSFAAPKVTAGIAAGVATGLSPLVAWQQLLSNTPGMMAGVPAQVQDVPNFPLG